MRLLFASDHAGLDLKIVLLAHARQLKHEATDLIIASGEKVDYPDFAHEVARRVAAGDVDFGVLVCGTGIGMSIVANRCRGVRAALCHDAFTAEAARRHNDANILCMGGRTTGPGVAVQMLDVFLSTPFDGGRHARRVTKIEDPGEVTAPRDPEK